jgi:hypothetical protein
MTCAILSWTPVLTFSKLDWYDVGNFGCSLRDTVPTDQLNSKIGSCLASADLFLLLKTSMPLSTRFVGST